MSSERGDAELASVMRKLLAAGVYLDAGRDTLTIDTGSLIVVSVTEDELQAVDEAVAAL